MHGRVRVRTSDELAAKIKKEKEEKAKVYLATMTRIYTKRKNQEYDEEMMTLTSAILLKNPDVVTLWNVRREAIKKFTSSFEPDEQLTDASYKRDQMCVVMKDELKLTQMCLLENPKSYSTWHHRCWLLENFASEQDWRKELELTEKFLEADERNFHCWQHRQFLLAHLDMSPKDEQFNYLTQKIMANMSNYSAWHYRSKLLHLAYPRGDKSERDFSFEILQEEIKVIENAAYTDPYDQSVWVYYRWLLDGYVGLCSPPLQFIQAGYNDKGKVAWVVVVVVTNKQNFATANAPAATKVMVKGFGDQPWTSSIYERSSAVLVKDVNATLADTDCVITITGPNDYENKISLCNEGKCAFEQPVFTPSFTLDERKHFEHQLRSFKTLLDLEPSAIYVMLAVNALSHKLGKGIDYDLFDKAKYLDPLRKTYYSDLASKYKMEELLMAVTEWNGVLVANDRSLTRLYYAEYFTLFHEIDLSNNPLGNKVIPQLKHSFSCKILKLSNCQITSISAFPILPSLSTLDLTNNKICTNEFGHLSRCSSLMSLLIDADVSSTTDLCDKLRNAFPELIVTLR